MPNLAMTVVTMVTVGGWVEWWGLWPCWDSTCYACLCLPSCPGRQDGWWCWACDWRRMVWEERNRGRLSFLLPSLSPPSPPSIFFCPFCPSLLSSSENFFCVLFICPVWPSDIGVAGMALSVTIAFLLLYAQTCIILSAFAVAMAYPLSSMAFVPPAACVQAGCVCVCRHFCDTFSSFSDFPTLGSLSLLYLLSPVTCHVCIIITLLFSCSFSRY